MKKIFTMVMLLAMGIAAAQAECQDGPYALYVNGASVYTFEDAGMSPDKLPQLHAVASLKQGDKVEICNTSCDAKWFPQNIETGGDVDGSGNFTITSGVVAICNVAGCYNFWWKKLANDDRVYIGTDGDCSGGGQGGQGGQGGLAGNPRFMWKAELDGDWREPSLSTMFVDGHSTISFYEKAYLFLIYQVDGSAGEEYMCEAYTDDTHARFVKGGTEKWGVPMGTTDLYIYDNGDGSVEVSNQPMTGKKIWTPGGAQGVENIPTSKKAHKVIIDGQLRIVRGGKMYDATGREL